ncbi:branched-chain amino acid ABC transporter permease [Parablautia sp. Marseille-Q6255]|uniref:branched-chain amino acid ABC transporter permease n=1 Tax=Parablautia sp. Marseille-Q6255 TaxID=3039593 RepID=UPI0024BCEBA5|nr:branched-chain amino acid ABC transporter permease [Parablautia sp. Marseille-Q6255]
MLARKKRNTPVIVITAFLILLIAVVPQFTSTYTVRILSVALINYLCVLSVYVLLGLCGQNSFAQAGFWGIGAYIAGNILTKTFGGSLTAFVAAVCGTAFLAFILGFAFFRLRQYYFTFASIGLMTILNVLFINWVDFSGGALGMKEIPTFQLFGFSADSETSKLYVVFAVCLVATFLILLLFHSSLGRSFMAIRDNEMAADSMGINSLLTKSIAFAISGALCGAAGAMWASVSGYLSYQSFTYNQSTIYLVMIMIGGTGSPIGALIGTAAITILQEGFRSLQDYMQLIYGIGVIILMIFQPEGIWGGGKILYERFRKHREKSKVSAV